MKTVVLNCKMFRERDLAHPYLAQMLQLPDYYGGNLDALYDCLTELGSCTLVLTGAEAVRKDAGYGAGILAAIEDAARDNPGLRLVLDGNGGGL